MSLKSNKLIKYLPHYEQKSSVFHEILGAGELQIKAQENIINDIKKQLSIDTATWALDIFEKELGIVTPEGKKVQDRRAVIKSKWRGVGKADTMLIKLTADAYSNGNVEVDFRDKVHIKMTSYHGVPQNFKDLKRIMRQIVPAHLDIIYDYRYLLNKDVQNKETIEEFNQLPLTHFAPIQAVSK